jgi:hypothetical protein
MKGISASLAGLLLACLLLAPAVQAQQGRGQSTADSAGAEVVQHTLSVYLDPFNSYIEVTDQLQFPESWRGNNNLSFSLNANLRIISSSLQIDRLGAGGGNFVPSTSSTAASSNQYQVSLPGNWNGELEIEYAGVINDQAEQSGAEYAQSFSETSGIISEQGVFLSHASAWIPGFGDSLLSFSLATRFSEAASSWSAMSQGSAAEPPGGSDEAVQSLWVETSPQEEIYLIANDFEIYRQQLGDIEALAYLRSADSNLATQYLDATARYLALYEPLLGDYPYDKFALVENFWETGYGMPSFTLLGPRVIRFPFILTTSYPHEILHNWWGNGVYPDYQTGNWSEGLTAYLADHLFREIDGRGGEYRKDMLARYKNYVAEDSDFPLTEFTSRNSAATQAVGYGKTLMLWHMLRVELGDELFLQGLRRFYNDYLYQRASWDDIEAIFSDISGSDLSAFFSQWTERSGAPELSVTVDEVNGNQARIMFAQVQLDDPYLLNLPIALFYEGEQEPQIYNIGLSQKLEGVMANDYDQLNAVLVDPYFDVFRTLDREETPPTIGELFGASEIAFVLPVDNRQQWAAMAEAFSEGVQAQILFADELEELPGDRSVWVLGRNNRFASMVTDSATLYGAAETASGYSLAGEQAEYADRSSVIIARHPANPELALGLIHIDDMVALPGMIEKLPHYGRYSYLSFFGDEPSNDISGIWASPESPMQWVKPGFSGEINWDNLPAEQPLAILPPEYVPEQMLDHILSLASPRMQGRGLGSAGLNQAANYIAEQFAAAGLQTVDGSYLQRWQTNVAEQGRLELVNIVGMIPGANEQFSHQPLVVGAHYDHLGIDPESGEFYPGADDNASGIAVMLEVASKLSRAFTPQRPILFVAFTAEEAGLLGSQYFIENLPGGFSAENLFAMINLDAVGRLEGRSLQVFGSDSAYEWPFMAQGIGFTIGVDSEFPQTIASSDHVSFLNAGIPAIHLFSGTHTDYHRVSDTVDKIDSDGLSDVALWLEEAVVYMADRLDPLRSNLAGAAPIEQSGQSGAREASLGTVPDFAYSGEGIRISGVTPNSAAAEAGLQEGDILLRYNAEAIEDLQHYSNLLRASAPGDAVMLGLRRGGRIYTMEVELKAR